MTPLGLEPATHLHGKLLDYLEVRCLSVADFVGFFVFAIRFYFLLLFFLFYFF